MCSVAQRSVSAEVFTWLCMTRRPLQRVLPVPLLGGLSSQTSPATWITRSEYFLSVSTLILRVQSCWTHSLRKAQRRNEKQGGETNQPVRTGSLIEGAAAKFGKQDVGGGPGGSHGWPEPVCTHWSRQQRAVVSPERAGEWGQGC